MARQGRYTKKVSLLTRIKRDLKRRWRWFSGLSKKKKFAIIATPILVILIIIPLVTYLYYYNDIADKERLMNRNNTGVVLTDKEGEAFYSTGRAEHRKQASLNDISDDVKNALIAAEDKEFYQHEGFSITGIIRAFYNNLVARGVTGGGSTITQQLAKNTLLSEDQTFMRKYQELAISVAIEQRYSKDEILEMYLNSAFFGGNVFGIEDAAQSYFGKSPKDLNLAESSMLIGVLPAPNAYSPTLGSPKFAKQRQNTVLTRMVDNGYITEAQKKQAQGVELVYKPMSQTKDSDAPHYVQMVLNELYDRYGEEKVQRSGYQVRTSLDLTLQRQLKQNIANHIPYVNANGGSNASAVAIDPRTGEIRALVGSADWNNDKWGKVNMVTTARQPGSSFKPIYFSKALVDGVITPATMIADVPTDFNGYKPENASLTYSGQVSVRNALARSLNIPAVKVMEELGVQKSVEAARQLGITDIKEENNYGLALALGAAEAPLMQMTNAYAAFANKGEQYSVATIEQINDKFNNNVFKLKQQPRTAISEEGAYLVSSILSDNNARAPIFGSSLDVPGHTVAVKTGTTDDRRDAWTIGYTPDLAVGVWVGNNDNVIMHSGGSDMAGPIWVATMNEALRGRQDQPFAVPSGVVQRSVCYSDGGLAPNDGAGTYGEYFLAWKLPSNTCTIVEEKKEEPATRPQDSQPSTNRPPQQQDPDPSDDDDEEPTAEEPTDPDDDNGGVIPPIIPPVTP